MAKKSTPSIEESNAVTVLERIEEIGRRVESLSLVTAVEVEPNGKCRSYAGGGEFYTSATFWEESKGTQTRSGIGISGPAVYFKCSLAEFLVVHYKIKPKTL